jgi:hypothetical protein
MKTITLHKIKFRCADIISGVPINPELPEGFDATPNESRPESHLAWIGTPYVVAREGWACVRCLDGGAWDRSSNLGQYSSIAEAVAAAANMSAR